MNRESLIDGLVWPWEFGVRRFMNKELVAMRSRLDIRRSMEEVSMRSRRRELVIDLNGEYWDAFDQALDSHLGEDHPLIELDEDLDDLYGNLTVSAYGALRGDSR